MATGLELLRGVRIHRVFVDVVILAGHELRQIRGHREAEGQVGGVQVRELGLGRRIVDIHVVIGIPDRQAVGDVPQQVQAADSAFGGVVLLAGARRVGRDRLTGEGVGDGGPGGWLDIVVEAIALVRRQADLGRQAAGAAEVEGGQVEGAIELAVAEVAHAGAQLAAQLTGGFLGDHVDGTAGGVAAKQGALGAAQNFNPLDFRQLENVAGEFADIGAVQVNADGGFPVDGRVGGDRATNGDSRLGGVGGQRRYLDIGGEGAEVHQVAHAFLFQLVLAEGGDGDGGVLQGLFAFLCSHHNFFQLGLGLAGSQYRGGKHQGCQMAWQSTGAVHCHGQTLLSLNNRYKPAWWSAETVQRAGKTSHLSVGCASPKCITRGFASAIGRP